MNKTIVKYIVRYLCGLFMGIVIFGAIPSWNYARNMRNSVQKIADVYAKKMTLPSVSGGPARIAGFDKEKNTILYLSPDNDKSLDSLEDDEKVILQKVKMQLDRTLQGASVTHFSLIMDDRQGYNGILICSGVPLYQNDTIVGSLFQFRVFFSLFRTIVTFFWIYTLLSILLCAILFIREKRRLCQKETDQLKKTYIDNVTHALKTPVNSVRIMAEALCDAVVDDPERQKLYYGRILLETKKQERMIRDILKLSEIQNHQMDMTKHIETVDECFFKVFENYKELCSCMGITLHISDAIKNLPLLYTNIDCMQEVMKILLDNAMKFTPEGGKIWVDAQCRRATERKFYYRARKEAVICVRDNGVGIPDDKKEMIFERFYKGRQIENTSGSGLGLAIAKELLENLKETIWAESMPDQGASFCFTISLGE